MMKTFKKITVLLVFILSFSSNTLGAVQDEIAQRALDGSIEDQFKMGEQFIEQDKFAIAKFWFLKAARQGHAISQFNLGLIYHYGLLSGHPNSGQALKWLSLAAEQGLTEAQYAIGEIYRIGYQIPKDVKLSLNWLTKAAEAENTEAQNSLAVLYYEGNDVGRNLDKAFFWREKAALNGDAFAQKALVAHYFAGEGIAKSTVNAYAWVLVTDDSTDSNLKLIKKSLEDRLSQQDVNLAKEKAHLLKNKIKIVSNE